MSLVRRPVRRQVLRTGALPLLFALHLAFVLPAHAQTGDPDPTTSTATSNSGHILITPEGSGESLAAAGLTITVTVRDDTGATVPNVDRSRIRLGSPSGDIQFCPGEGVAEFDTDSNGMTTFSGALRGGGHADGDLLVYVDDQPLTGSPLDIEVNSPDITADVKVNLSDIAELAQDLKGGTFRFRTDLWRDDVIDLVDLSLLALYRGEAGVCAE